MSGFLVVLLYLVAAAAALHAARREAPRAAFHETTLYLAAAALAAHAAWLADTIGPARQPLARPRGQRLADGARDRRRRPARVFAPRFRTVAAICLVLAALLAAGTGSLPAPHEIAPAGWPLAVHVVLAMGSAGMFAIAAVFVVLLALQDPRCAAAAPADGSRRCRRSKAWNARCSR